MNHDPGQPGDPAGITGGLAKLSWADLPQAFEAMGLEPLEGQPGTWIDPTDPLARFL
ncbi:MAG: hypothetical protein U0800_08525 [Isosphaeraceae bacterium]